MSAISSKYLVKILESHRTLILGLIVVIAAAAILVSARDMLRFAGFDLRPKVLGARALLSGLDPYLSETLRWTAETPLALVDPEVVFYAGTGLSRVTYPPSLLLIYMPLANLPYKVQRIVWWLIEWAAMAGAIAALAASLRDRNVRLAFVSVAVVGICGSYFWRWHAERGQYYVFLILLIGLEFIALRRAWEGRPAWQGVPFGVAIAFRPTFVMALPLLWVMGARRAAIVSAASTALIVVATLPFAGITEWRHYFENASTMGRQVAGIGQRFTSVVLPPPEGASYFIEGYDFSPSQELRALSPNLTLCGLTGQPWCLPLSHGLAALTAVLSLAVAFGLRRICAPHDLFLLLLVTTIALFDYLLPMRWSYADVIFLPMLAILVPAVLARPILIGVLSVVAALLSCLAIVESPHTAILRQALFLAAACVVASTMPRSAPEAANPP